MTRSVVTGGTGFVAANLVRRLLVDGGHVVATVQRGADSWRLEDVRGDVELVDLDIRDADAVDAVVSTTAPETIFHLAANGAYSWQQERALIFETNVNGTLNVLESAARHDVASVVVAGSSSEYGFQDHAPAESEAPLPNSDYAAAKAAATLYANYFGRTQGIDTTVLRLYSVYGPWEDPRRLIPALVSAALEGKLPPLADGGIARDFVYVDDVCEAFVRAAGRREPGAGAIFNVGSGRQTRLADIVEVVRTLFGISAEPEWNSMAPRSWDTDVWVSDPSLIEARLGWKATTPLEDGLAATARWLESSAHRARYRLPDRQA